MTKLTDAQIMIAEFKIEVDRLIRTYQDRNAYQYKAMKKGIIDDLELDLYAKYMLLGNMYQNKNEAIEQLSKFQREHELILRQQIDDITDRINIYKKETGAISPFLN